MGDSTADFKIGGAEEVGHPSRRQERRDEQNLARSQAAETRSRWSVLTTKRSKPQGKDIIVWQQPDLRLFAKFGQGGKDQSLGNDDAINWLVACRRGIVYSTSADGKIKAWGMEKEREWERKFKKSSNN
ncbi:hypothetical protein PIB30_007881 [Stylosanthes scabra]|uniref:Uncharacterized protein n=1 Tax=Stylosanthes scabra TaxID=79078 RepID=A0ABU6R542_9FABA|nr:hypothetical protein [Stylosanthes scabra]